MNIAEALSTSVINLSLTSYQVSSLDLRGGVSQRPLTLILPQKYRDTNGRRIVIQIGGTTFCHREGIRLQKYAIEMGGVSRYFFTCSGVGGRLGSPE